MRRARPRRALSMGRARARGGAVEKETARRRVAQALEGSNTSTRRASSNTSSCRPVGVIVDASSRDRVGTDRSFGAHRGSLRGTSRPRECNRNHRNHAPPRVCSARLSPPRARLVRGRSSLACRRARRSARSSSSSARSRGLGGLEADVHYDTRIFSLATLLCSTLVYNSLGSIDENAINNLSFVANLAQHIKVRYVP